MAAAETLGWFATTSIERGEPTAHAEAHGMRSILLAMLVCVYAEALSHAACCAWEYPTVFSAGALLYIARDRLRARAVSKQFGAQRQS